MKQIHYPLLRALPEVEIKPKAGFSGEFILTSEISLEKLWSFLVKPRIPDMNDLKTTGRSRDLLKFISYYFSVL